MVNTSEVNQIPINKIYIINLLRRQDKRKHMQQELDKLNGNIEYEFFDAIDGTDQNQLSQYKFKVSKWNDPKTGKTMTNGEVGCALSHYLVWKKIVESENDNYKVLIIEDDIIFDNDFINKLNIYLNEINTDYDMLYLHRKIINSGSEHKLSDHITTVGYSYWACSYILTYNGAKKLINTSFLNNLIPTDEFLPIMYGCKVLGYEKIFDECEKLKCFSVTPSLIQLTDKAFIESETFKSNPYISNQKNMFCNDKEFILIYAGSQKGNSFERFVDYCQIYGLNYFCLNENNDLAINNLKTELETWTNDKLISTLILIIGINDNKYCNIIPLASPTEIINKFDNLTENDNKKIIISLKKNKINHLCGFGSNILTFINDYNYKYGLVNDNMGLIFQVLENNTQQLTFDYKKSRVKHISYNINPALVFTNDNNKQEQCNLYLNSIENYTGNGWNEYYGFSLSTKNIDTYPKVYISIALKENIKILNILNNLNYPKESLTIKINRLSNSMSMDELFLNDVKNFLQTDSEYYFFIDNNCVITNENILNHLLKFNKYVIAPLLVKPNTLWTNFWGALDDKGYYQRSFDYIDIINGNKKGCWNVPYVTGVFLINRNILEKNPDIFNENKQIDCDMRFCYNCRANDIFMYVTNLETHGYLDDDTETNQDKLESNELTIYDLFKRKDEWEKKYLHPKYYQNKNDISKMEIAEPCDNIYNFPLFSEEFCKEMIETMEKNGNWSKGLDNHHDPRLGGNNYENVPTQDIHLYQINFDKHWEKIVNEYIAPVTSHVYSRYKTKGINISFVVRYHWQLQSKLDPHHDASTYTINIALNKGGVDYEGGGCRFIRQNFILKNQDTGMCCMHPGRLTCYHEGLPTTKGIRYILVSFIN